MHPALALYFASALLVLVAGLPKLVRPTSTVRVLDQAGLRASGLLVRTFGAVEIALAAVVLVIGGVLPGLLLAVLYVAFSLFVARALLRGNVSSCGCFAGEDAPPSMLHVLLNAGLATVGLWTALTGGAVAIPDVRGAFGAGQAAGLVAAAILDACLLYLVMTRFPSAAPVVPGRTVDRHAHSRPRVAQVRA